MYMSVVPVVPEGGNTKPLLKSVNPAKKWCFTLNNYTDIEYSSICSKLTNSCLSACVGKEVGESGTPHLQGYFEFKTKDRPKSVFQDVSNRIHFELAKGSKESNLTYCSKENLCFSLGMPKPIKIITELRPFQLEIETLILTEPDDRSIYWYYDYVGNIGKSAFIKYCVVKYNVLYICSGKYSDIMNILFNADMNTITCVMLDIPRANSGNVSYASLESIKNGLVCNHKYETGSKVFNSPHVVVFANFPPQSPEKLSADRWKIKNLSPDAPIPESVISYDED